MKSVLGERKEAEGFELHLKTIILLFQKVCITKLLKTKNWHPYSVKMELYE